MCWNQSRCVVSRNTKIKTMTTGVLFCVNKIRITFVKQSADYRLRKTVLYSTYEHIYTDRHAAMQMHIDGRYNSYKLYRRLFCLPRHVSATLDVCRYKRTFNGRLRTAALEAPLNRELASLHSTSFHFTCLAQRALHCFVHL